MNSDELAEIMLLEKRRSTEIASELGMSIDRVKRIKKRLGLSTYRSPNSERPQTDLFRRANKLMKIPKIE